MIKYTKRVIIVPYKLFSTSAKQLKAGLQQKLDIPVLLISKNSPTYQPRWTDYVINWGCSAEWPWINTTEKHMNTDAVDKLQFFQRINAHNKVFKNCQVNIPEWTTDANEAKEWNKDFFARTILKGHSGAGIVEYTKGTLPKNAPLYVQYKKKRDEFRCHFFKEQGGVYKLIDITQKKKRKDFENVNTKVRNHQNGWVYAREGIIKPEDLSTQALNAAFASGLSFGAVDLIWNEKENKCYVLEVNTAPGITGTTLTNYITTFIQDIT